jgi:hypothetical protein
VTPAHSWLQRISEAWKNYKSNRALSTSNQAIVDKGSVEREVQTSDLSAPKDNEDSRGHKIKKKKKKSKNRHKNK